MYRWCIVGDFSCSSDLDNTLAKAKMCVEQYSGVSDGLCQR